MCQTYRCRPWQISSSESSLRGSCNEICIDVEREEDGRWIAEVSDLPGVLAYGSSAAEAKRASRRSPYGSWPFGRTTEKRIPTIARDHYSRSRA